MWRVLEDEANHAGRKSGFIKRKRTLTGASFVQSLVFGYLANASSTTDEIRQAAATLGVDITRQGLDKRFSAESAACLKQVLEATVKEVFKADPVDVDILKRFEGVHLFDSSTIILPSSLSDMFAGCGGSNDTNTQASVKVCIDFDLLTGALDGPIIQSGRVHDRQALGKHSHLEAGSLWMADLAYFKLDDFEQMTIENRYFLSRFKIRTKLFTVEGEPLELATWLKKTSDHEIDMPIKLGKKHRLSCRLMAVRVPNEVAKQRRKRLREEARKRGQGVSRERLALVHWTIYVTNVPQALLSVEEALVLGRSRWQVEMLFKLWKSDGLIDESRSENPWHILTEFYAKLIAMIIQHWLFLIELWDHPERSLHQASQVMKKHAFHLASVFHRVDELYRAIQIIQRCLTGCRMSKCKSKHHTYELWIKFNS
jgi:hypothetical protein